MLLPSNQTECRICRAQGARKRGDVEFYVGYRWSIYDCAVCGCLFTPHDNAVYERLYCATSSCYNRYIGQSDACKKLFDRGDRAGLRRALSHSSKYSFVIDELESYPQESRLLEVGTSRGHLASYFILAGRDVTGVDVSPTAVAAASAAFGNHFRLAGDPAIKARAPYDGIFHVGTIGCVADPIGMTRALLDILRPGGRLIFNAPNREALTLNGQQWFDGAPPPDVVTMFRPGFWRETFGDVAEVSEEVEIGAPIQNLLIGLRNLARRRWRPPVPIRLEESARQSEPAPGPGDRTWYTVERVVRKLAPSLGLLHLAPRHPAEYGLFIKMRRYSSNP
jgi:SAM-dependent methyltransferase